MKKSFLFFVSLSIACIITERFFYFVISRFEKNVFTGQSVGKTNQFLKVKDSVKLIIAGDSRANHHINPKLLPIKSYNIGLDGRSLISTATLIRTINTKNKILLVHIDPHNLYDQQKTKKDVLSLKHLYHKSAVVKKSIRNYCAIESYLYILFPSLTLNGMVLPILKNSFYPKHHGISNNGFEPLTPSKRQQEFFVQLQKVSENKNPPYIFIDTILNPVIHQSILDMVDHGNKINLKIIFFTSPSHLYFKPGEKNPLILYFDNLGVSYWDDSQSLNTGNPNYWKDYTHMSKKGANIYTKMVGQRIRVVLENYTL